MAAAMPHLSGRSRRGLDIATAGAALLILLGLSRVTPVTAEAAGAPTQRAKAREARAEARAAEETALLGPRFRAFETRWFVLVTDTSADRASALAAALDGAADRFLDISQRWGARVSRPEGRMLVVFFAHQRDKWWMVTADMWTRMGKVGIIEGFDQTTLLGDVFSIRA